MTPDLSYDWEGERKRRAKIVNGMGKKNPVVLQIFKYSYDEMILYTTGTTTIPHYLVPGI